MSGALDAFAFAVANLLVENPENTAVMELTVMGPALEIKQEMDIALTGARMGITVNGISHDQWRSIRVKPGDSVSIGQIESGCRSYLAFKGGISVPEIMGSASTYAGGQIGGFNGRPLQKGDGIDIPDVPLKPPLMSSPSFFWWNKRLADMQKLPPSHPLIFPSLPRQPREIPSGLKKLT